jgi:hypothetical protein
LYSLFVTVAMELEPEVEVATTLVDAGETSYYMFFAESS